MTDNVVADRPLPVMPSSVTFNYDGESIHAFDRSPGTQVAGSGWAPTGGGSRSDYDERYSPPRRVVRSVSELFDDFGDETSPARLVGKQVTADGRVLGAVDEEDDEGQFAGSGDQDSHDRGGVFDVRVKSTKKAGRGDRLVQVGNADARYAARQLAAAEASGALPSPNIMREIIDDRLREMRGR
jgi:hypothetical protein